MSNGTDLVLVIPKICTSSVVSSVFTVLDEDLEGIAECEVALTDDEMTHFSDRVLFDGIPVETLMSVTDSLLTVLEDMVRSSEGGVVFRTGGHD